MTQRQAPRLAVWLLTRFDATGSNEPLAGDLLEEYRAGRSAGWYWRQVLAAIASGTARAYLRDRNKKTALLGWIVGTAVASVFRGLHVEFPLAIVFYWSMGLCACGFLLVACLGRTAPWLSAALLIVTDCFVGVFWSSLAGKNLYVFLFNQAVWLWGMTIGQRRRKVPQAGREVQ